MLWLDEAFHEVLPALQVGGGGINSQVVDHEAVDLVATQVERTLVDCVFHVAEGHYVLLLDVTEHCDLTSVVLVKVVLGAADDDVRLDSDFAQLGYRLLGGLGLDLPRRPDEGQEGDVNEADILAPHLQGKLTEGLQEEVPLDVPDGAANLGNDDVDLGVL